MIHRLTKAKRIDRIARAFPTDGCYHRWDGETLEMLLPSGPSVNTYWRHAKGMTYISADGKAYRQAVAKILDGAHKFGSARLRIAVVLHGADKRDRDLDNFGGKALLDSLVFAGVLDDDAQIDDLRIVRGAMRKGGLFIVRIREIPPLIPDWTAAKLFED